jgi:hypothetical protein
MFIISVFYDDELVLQPSSAANASQEDGITLIIHAAL